MSAKSIDICKSLSYVGSSNGGVWKTSDGGNWWSSQNCAATESLGFVNNGGMTEMILNRAFTEMTPEIMALKYNMWADLVTTADVCKVSSTSGSPTGLPPGPCKSESDMTFAIYLEVSPKMHDISVRPSEMELGQMAGVIRGILVQTEAKGIVINWKTEAGGMIGQAPGIKLQPEHVAVQLNFANEIKTMKRPVYMRWAYMSEIVVSETLRQEVMNRIGAFGSTVTWNVSLYIVSIVYVFFASF